MKSIPPIKSVMTPFPYWVDAGEPAGRAAATMVEHGVHHLPVMEKGQPVGVLKADDTEGAGKSDTAGSVCNRNVYIVDFFEPLDRVLTNMAEERYESALVVRDGKLVGIFTITDACRYFGQLLRTLFPRSDGDAA